MEVEEAASADPVGQQSLSSDLPPPLRVFLGLRLLLSDWTGCSHPSFI